MRNSQELKDFMQAANPTVCMLLSRLLKAAEGNELRKLVNAVSVVDVRRAQGRVQAFRSIDRLVNPRIIPDAEDE